MQFFSARISSLIAVWPWAMAYVTVCGVILLVMRRYGSTDALAASLDAEPHSTKPPHGFGEPCTLRGVAAEFLKLSCAKMLFALTGLVVVVRLAIGQWSAWDLAVMAGVMAFWPLQEWLVHVFLLHLKPVTLWGRSLDPIVARNHRNHHRHPWHPELGITPIHILWIYMAGIPALWMVALPLPLAMTGVVTYFALVFNYEWLHYLIHTSYVPRSFFYRRLWRNHRLHHFKNENYWYGVTMLGGDWIMNTQPPLQQAPKSETCLNLGVSSALGK